MLALLAAAAAALTVARPCSWSSGLVPRLQWLGNDGYCGEVSVQMAGLKYGRESPNRPAK